MISALSFFHTRKEAPSIECFMILNNHLIVERFRFEYIKRYPNPEHQDTHATNCFLTQTGCVCKACGNRINFLEMAQATTGKNYPQSIQFISDLIH